jgi:hypothetical protein
VSHLSERKEKNCLNCEAVVHGRYCHVCGQENTVTKQGVGSLIKHFIYDIFHFDGKFFDTLKYLLIKPGFVPKEYIAGKRISYLDPIRMYLFTSAIFFLVFFSLSSATDGIIRMDGNIKLMTKVERLEYSSTLYQHNTQNPDSLTQKQLRFLLDTSFQIMLSGDIKPPNDSLFSIWLKKKRYMMVANKIANGRNELNVGKDWLSNTIKSKWNSYRQKFADDESAMVADLTNSFVHKFPYILFISLPFFAFILKLLYVRRKQFYYSDHAIFTLYQYIFSFFILLFYFLFSAMYEWLHWGIFRFFAAILMLSGGVYLFLAMKRFYGQGWLKTLGKFLLLNAMAFVTLILIFILFLIFALFQL